MVPSSHLMQKEAAALQNALAAIGCTYPVRLVDHNTALQIDTYTEGTMLVRHEGNTWEVVSHSSVCSGCQHFANMEECIREVALCQVGCVFDHTEERIDAAIKAAFWN
ncbi:MAG: hypothetical protein HC893_01030 [Chloroflexaceae bacterium]|nr:hypothetical protein [Chloroflexaceae bacterium]NJL32685.1 hypothetical protein [Chloroflexaceae bacterium]NJO05133.1 hypothetical protein [Chloroflexaceae bacterium]NJO83078.1 hypothetical protein [Blastochloris sp.]